MAKGCFVIEDPWTIMTNPRLLRRYWHRLVPVDVLVVWIGRPAGLAWSGLVWSGYCCRASVERTRPYGAVLTGNHGFALKVTFGLRND